MLKNNDLSIGGLYSGPNSQDYRATKIGFITSKLTLELSKQILEEV